MNAFKMDRRDKELIQDNLNAFVSHFNPIRIEKEDYGRGYYVYQGDSDSYIQFCYDVHYLNGWLYGAVQAKCGIIEKR